MEGNTPNDYGQKVKKKSCILNKLLSITSRKKNREEKRRSTKDAPRDIENIVIITGVEVSKQPQACGRKTGLSEKSETDRDALKYVLNEVIRQENIENFTH